MQATREHPDWSYAVTAPSPTITANRPRVAIVGGGQLGRMLTMAAARLGVEILIVGPDPHAPATEVGATAANVGWDTPPVEVDELHGCRVVTFELEAVPESLLAALADAELPVAPRTELLALLRDKGQQRAFFADAGLPQPRWTRLDTPTATEVEAFGLPAVQKLRVGGYDGRGVHRVESKADLADLLPGPSILEQRVDLAAELAVMVARNAHGETAVYPVAEQRMDAKRNLLNVLFVPADVSETIRDAAQTLAIQAVEALDGVGIFGVELFFTHDDQLLINEVAPRPHNSGHYTLDACVTDQFEQHLRAVMGLPLGATTLLKPAATANILGAEGFRGETVVEGLERVCRRAAAKVHLYGKRNCWPGRKMGHVTVLNDDPDVALQDAVAAKDELTVRGAEQWQG